MGSHLNELPELDSSYTDQYGPIDLTVYNAARKIWSKAKVFAEFALQDDTMAFDLMLKAAAAVSERLETIGRLRTVELPESPQQIRDLRRYLFSTYKNLVASEKSERIKRERSQAELNESFAVDIIADIEQKILMREIFNRMSAEERDLCTYVMLGYRHDEIADILKMSPSAVRQKFSRLKRRLTTIFSHSEPSETL
jgi:hypothetical protein